MKPPGAIRDLHERIRYCGDKYLLLGITRYGTLCKKTSRGWRYLTLAERLHVWYVFREDRLVSELQ
jgi:hypothetical protein